MSPRTKSGALISKIEEPFKNNISFYKTNIVKCLPLFNDKLRYPLKHEMDKCYPNLKDEIATLKPTKIFLLGTQVAQFILSKYLINTNTLNEHFNYELYVLNNIVLIPIHHPSFVLIYRRKNIDNYIKGVSKLINEIPISQH